MSRLVVIGAVLVLLCWPVSAAQNNAIPSLQRIIDKPFAVAAKATPCGSPTASVWLIAAKTGVLAGAESLPGPCVHEDEYPNLETVELRGMTVEAALNKLVEIDPRYQWAVRDGVIVMRPVEAWSNPNNPLNQVIDGFSMQDRNFRGALDLFRSRVFGEPPSDKPDYDSPVSRGEQMRRKFTMTTPAGPAVDALDSIARAHGGLTWYVQYKTAPASVDGMVVWLYTFDDVGTLTSRRSSR
jgi:hypothetical protein